MVPHKVLIIDDCKLNLAITRDILEEAGYEVQTAESALSANQYIYDAEPPDVILIDVVMPLLQGDEKVRFLKGREASSAIPVLLISHKTEVELAELSRKSGADGYLTKPFEKTTLLNEIRRFF